MIMGNADFVAEDHTLRTRLSRINRPGERSAARIGVIAATIGLLILWSSAVTILYITHRDTISEEGTLLERMAGIVEEQTSATMSEIDLFLSLTATHYRQHPGLDPRWDLEFTPFAEQFRQRSRRHPDVLLVSGSGELIPLPLNGIPSRINVADRDYFQAQLHPETQGLFFGKPVVSRRTGLWTIPVSYPIPRNPGNISAIVATIPSINFEIGFAASRPPHNGSIALFRSDGILLSRAPADDRNIGRSLAKGELWTKFLPFGPRGIARLKHSLFGPGERLLAYTTLEDYPLVVVVAEPLDVVLASWHRMARLLIFGCALLTALVVTLTHRLITQLVILSQTRQELEDQAQTDSLTGLYNRRQFNAMGEVELARAHRYRHPVALLYFDLDHFKQINDLHGHAVGDEALIFFSQKLRSSLRSADIPVRLGGEEFAALLPETTPDNAYLLAERIRTSLANEQLRAQRGRVLLKFTVSIGVAWTEPIGEPESLASLSANADQALYQAKRSGRNQTVMTNRSPAPEAAIG